MQCLQSAEEDIREPGAGATGCLEWVLGTEFRSSATGHTLNNSIVSPGPKNTLGFYGFNKYSFVLDLLIYILCRGVLSIHHMHAYITCGGQKKAPDPLEL